jgi:hypothetical protein
LVVTLNIVFWVIIIASIKKGMRKLPIIFCILVGLIIPSAALAISYTPGQTLDPACTPQDPTCVVTSPSATNQAAVFVATSTTATSTFAGNTAVSGNASSTNVTVSNTLTIGALSGILKAVAGVVQTSLVNLSADVSGILGITNGGTGTTTAPTYGQVLVGNGSGGYNLIATSSLGIAGNSQWATASSNIYFTAGNVGIGTTSPSQALSVSGNGYFTGSLSSGGTLSVAGLTTLGNATTTNQEISQALTFSGNRTYAGTGTSSPSNSFLFMPGSTLFGTAAAAPNGVISPFNIYISGDQVDTTSQGNGNLIDFSVLGAVSAGHTGGREAFQSYLNIVGSPAVTPGAAGYVGGQFVLRGSANLLGTGGAYGNYKGGAFGSNSNIYLTAGATYYGLVNSEEFDVTVPTGASTADKYGISIVKGSNDAVRGAYDDSAISINDQDNSNTQGWHYGLSFGSYAHQWAFATDSTLIMAQTRQAGPASPDVALNGVDFRNVTFSAGGNAFASNGFSVDPSGNLIGANITATGTLTANTLSLSKPLAVADGGTGLTNFVPPNAINILSYGVSTSSSDNATGLQNAINAAVSTGVPLYIPAASSCYKYTAPLTISGNLTIVGDYVSGNWNSGINVPLGTPPLLGSVLCPSSNGSDAIDISGTSLQVNISNLGILFQNVFSGTGDGIHYIPSGTTQGLTNASWQNVMVYGHDGNHYAFNLQNPIYGSFLQTASFGGGGWNLMGSSGGLNFGNATFVQPYVQVIVGGSANGYTITASSSQKLNLLTFIRPQSIVNNISGVSPSGNLPTSAQSIWSMDANVRNVRTISPDFETNVGSSFSAGASGLGNDLDWNSLFTDAATINAPAWTTGGIMYGPQTRTFNDTTSSGTGSNTGMFAFPGTHVTASNVVTYPVLSTLYVSPPILGTNASASRLDAIYATGEIYTTGDIGSNSGLFVTGTTQINHNFGSVTQIGDGTASGAVTIGGVNNKVGISTSTAYSKLEVWGPDSAATTSAFAVVNNASTTVFSVFDNGNATYSGSIFQSSDQRLKTNILSLDASSSLAAINGLNPVSYNRIDQDTGINLGFIAQQVQQIFPDLVSTTSPTALTPGGTLTLNYVGLIAPLVKSVQALSQEIASLESTVSGFAQKFISNNITANNQLCVGSTCVTPAQFQAMVAVTNAPKDEELQSSNTVFAVSDATSDASITPPIVEINGTNPATIQVGDTYSDLGATITGPSGDLNLGIHVFVGSTPMDQVIIDTSAPARYHINYVVTDANGLTSTSTRTVIVKSDVAVDAADATSTSQMGSSDKTTATSTASSTAQ